MTVTEVAERFGCSNQTVRNRIRSGEVRRVLKVPVDRRKTRAVFLLPEDEAVRIFSGGVAVGRPRRDTR